MMGLRPKYNSRCRTRVSDSSLCVIKSTFWHNLCDILTKVLGFYYPVLLIVLYFLDKLKWSIFWFIVVNQPSVIISRTAAWTKSRVIRWLSDPTSPQDASLSLAWLNDSSTDGKSQDVTILNIKEDWESETYRQCNCLWPCICML